jgi:hypothetical protein
VDHIRRDRWFSRWSGPFERKKPCHNLRRLKNLDGTTPHLDEPSVPCTEVEIPPTRMTVRLATGASVKVMKRVAGLHYTLEGEEYDNEFIVLDLDGKFDVILGLP